MYIIKLGSSEAWVNDCGYTLLKESAKVFKSLNEAIKGKKKWMKKHGRVYVKRARRAGGNFDLKIDRLEG